MEWCPSSVVYDGDERKIIRVERRRGHFDSTGKEEHKRILKNLKQRMRDREKKGKENV